MHGTRQQSSEPFKVLVADDDPTCCAMLRRTLEGWGLEVIETCDGWDAWNTLQAYSDIRLAVVNWLMPGLDGHRLCRLLAASPSRRLGVVLMVGGAFVQDVSNWLPSNLVVCLAKPFGETQLRQSLLKAGWTFDHAVATMAGGVA